MAWYAKQIFEWTPSTLHALLPATDACADAHATDACARRAAPDTTEAHFREERIEGRTDSLRARLSSTAAGYSAYGISRRNNLLLYCSVKYVQRTSTTDARLLQAIEVVSFEGFQMFNKCAQLNNWRAMAQRCLIKMVVPVQTTSNSVHRVPVRLLLRFLLAFSVGPGLP